MDAQTATKMLRTALVQNINAQPWQRKLVAFLWGAPGIAKSSLIRQLRDWAEAQYGSAFLIERRLATSDPTDLSGIPTADGEFTRFLQPDMMRVILKAAASHAVVIVFLDEYMQAPVLVRQGASQILDGEWNGQRMPKNVVVIGASNRKLDKSGTIGEMEHNQRTRFMHMPIDPTLDAFANWGNDNGIHEAVIAFCRTRAELLCRPTADGYTFPTLRTWECASEVLKTDAEPEIKRLMIDGVIGEAASVEFHGFLEIRGVCPTADQIIAAPTTIKMVELDDPRSPSIFYSVVTSLARVANAKNITAICKFLRRIPAEYAAVCMKDIKSSKATVGLLKHPDVSKWLADFHEVVA